MKKESTLRAAIAAIASVFILFVALQHLDAVKQYVNEQTVRGLQQQHRWRDALERSQNWRTGPRSAVRLASIAYSEYKLGLDKNALDDCNSALELDPRSTQALITRAMIYFDRLELKQAKADCTLALALDRGDAAVLGFSSIVQAALHDSATAQQLAKEVQAVAPNSEMSWLARAALAENEQDLRPALAFYDKVIELDPTDFRAHVACGLVYYKSELFYKAQQEYDRALELDSDWEPAYLCRTWTDIQLQRLDQALADATRAVNICPDDPLAHNCRAAALIEKQRYIEALADCERALKGSKDAKAVPLQLRKAMVLSFIGRGPEALNIAQNVLDKEPKNRAALIRQIFCLLELKRYDETVAAADRMMKIYSIVPLAQAYRGISEYAQNKTEQAAKDRDAALFDASIMRLVQNEDTSKRRMESQRKPGIEDI